MSIVVWMAHVMSNLAWYNAPTAFIQAGSSSQCAIPYRSPKHLPASGYHAQRFSASSWRHHASTVVLAFTFPMSA